MLRHVGGRKQRVEKGQTMRLEVTYLMEIDKWKSGDGAIESACVGGRQQDPPFGGQAMHSL